MSRYIQLLDLADPKHLDSTVIPGKVEAQISLRIVPDQDLDTIVQSLRDHLQKSFDDLHSPNTLQVRLMLLGN